MNLRRTVSFLAGFAVSTTTALATAAPTVAEDIRGIRPPLFIAPWWRVPLVVALATLATFAIAVAVRALVRRLRRGETPLAQALRALRAAEEHARHGRSRQWADLMADTLRRALAARLGLEVLPKTTSELAKTAWAAWAYEGPVARAPDADDRMRLLEAPQLIELLQVCDLARFACAPLDTGELLASTARARELLLRLHAPRPEPRSRHLSRELAV